jgi:hypothetical protein
MTLTKSLMLTCAAIFLSGCVQTTSCDWAKPIRPTANDVAVVSDGLARDLLVHNQTGAKLCGWR